MSEGQVPIRKIAKRLKVSYGFLKRIKDNDLSNPETAFKRKSKHPRFHKIHGRARDQIRQMLDEA